MSIGSVVLWAILAGLFLVVELVTVGMVSLWFMVGALAAQLMDKSGMNAILVIFLCLMVGAVIGGWQGFWIGYVHIPPFICTLSGMFLFRGLHIVCQCDLAEGVVVKRAYTDPDQAVASSVREIARRSAPVAEGKDLKKP